MWNLNDRYFAAGIVGAFAALYAASMFAYFSSEGVQIAKQFRSYPDAAQVSSHTHAVPAESAQLRVIKDKTQLRGVFSPLGNASPVVPGVDCRVTSMNLDLSYNFRDVPEGCIKMFEE